MKNLSRKIKKLCPNIIEKTDKDVILKFFKANEDWKKEDNDKTKLFWECIRECKNTDIIKKGDLYDFSGFYFPKFEKIEQDEYSKKILEKDKSFWKTGEKFTLENNVRCEKCNFMAKTSFSFVLFEKESDFSSSVFLGNTSFSEAIFNGKVLFGAGNNKKIPIEFKKEISFFRCKFNLIFLLYL